jgi:hypothetical protein
MILLYLLLLDLPGQQSLSLVKKDDCGKQRKF